MDYLARYNNGERVAVWRELTGLGGGVRKEPFYSQAEAVARETMRRVKYNVEILVKRLQSLNYKFLPDIKPLAALPAEALSDIHGLEQVIGLIPISLRVFYEEVGQVSLMGSHPKLSEYFEYETEALENTDQYFLELYRKYLGDLPAALAVQDPLQLSYNILSYRSELWMRIRSGESVPEKAQFEAINHELNDYREQQKAQRGTRPKLDVYSDPLVVGCRFVETGSGSGNDTYYKKRPAPYTIIVAPDPIFKANHTGGDPLGMWFPDAAIDAKILDEETDYGYFVEYLRDGFRWSGFPGFKHSKHPPMDELEFLKKDLLPI